MYVSRLSLWRQDSVPVYFVTRKALLPESYLRVTYIDGIMIQVPEYIAYLRDHGARVPGQLLEGPDGAWLRKVRPLLRSMDEQGNGYVVVSLFEYGPDDVLSFVRMEFKSGALIRFMFGPRYATERGSAIDETATWHHEQSPGADGAMP
jgi:hypothetical protein